MIEVKEPKKELPIIGSIKGMFAVAKHLFQKPVTIQYPEERPYEPDRFRFRIFLSLDDCVGCTLCEQVCPNKSITMQRSRGRTRGTRGRYTQM